MTAKLAAISREARGLSIKEKLLLARELVAEALAATAPAHEAAWKAEVQRRRKEVRSGKVKLVPGGEVERGLDRLLEK